MQFCKLFAVSGLLCVNAYASHPYFDDANAQSDAPLYAGNYPKVSLTETTSILGSAEAWSKYDVIGAKSGMSNKVAAVQGINPAVKFHYSFHPRSYVGYLQSDPCEIAMGMPFNGTGPATQGCAVYAGHWLYRAGTKLLSGINASELTLRVENATQLKAGQYLVIYDAPAGSFSNAEHAEIASVDTLAVPDKVVLKARGYKSSALSHGINSIVAQHELGTAKVPKQWAYNLSTACRRDSNNRTAAEAMANWIPQNMYKNSRGQVTGARVDGVYFDEDEYHLNADGVDANNDLVVDNGILASGANIWGAGLEIFYQLVRNKLPGLAVVGGYRESRGFDSLSGVQMENWLVTGGDADPDPIYIGNGGALSQLHNYLIHNEYHTPPSGYAEALSKNPTRLYPYSSKSGSNPPIPADNSTFRFGFGAALLGNGHYGRQNSDGNPDPWYDEYAVDVTPGSGTYGHAIQTNSSDESEVRAHKGWLGRPLGPRVRLYDEARFLPQNSMISNGGFEQGTGSWLLTNVDASMDLSSRVQGSQALKILKHSNYSPSLGGASVRGPEINLVKGRSYTLAFAAKSSAMRNIFVRLDWSANQGNYLVPTRWTRFVYTITAETTGTFRPVFYVGREDTTVWLDDVYVFEGDPNVFRRDYENGIVLVNARPGQATVDLGGTFQRILGTGQDAVNDGSSLTSVTLAGYDAAILVRRDGSPPVGGGSCGKPAINASGPPAMFVWADTCQAGRYHLTGTSNGPYRNYVGSVLAGGQITNVTKTLVEASDSVTVPNQTTLQFNLSVWNGIDSVDFSIPPGADLCFRVTGEDVLLAGPGAVPKADPLNLRTMQPCS